MWSGVCASFHSALALDRALMVKPADDRLAVLFCSAVTAAEAAVAAPASVQRTPGSQAAVWTPVTAGCAPRIPTEPTARATARKAMRAMIRPNECAATVQHSGSAASRISSSPSCRYHRQDRVRQAQPVFRSKIAVQAPQSVGKCHKHSRCVRETPRTCGANATTAEFGFGRRGHVRRRGTTAGGGGVSPPPRPPRSAGAHARSPRSPAGRRRAPRATGRAPRRRTG